MAPSLKEHSIFLIADGNINNDDTDIFGTNKVTHKYDLEYEGGGRSDDVDILEELHAVGLAENLREGLQLARLHVPLHEAADAAQLRPRTDEAEGRNLEFKESRSRLKRSRYAVVGITTYQCQRDVFQDKLLTATQGIRL